MQNQVNTLISAIYLFWLLLFPPLRTVSNDNVNSLDLLPTTTEIAAPFDFENFLENLDFNEFNGQHLYDYSDDERSETEVCVLEKCMPSYDLCLIESFSKQNSERDLSTNICIKTLNMCKTQCKAQEYWLWKWLHYFQ